MSSHFLVDKSMALEARFGGFALASGRTFPEPGAPPRFGPDRGYALARIDLSLDIDPVGRRVEGVARMDVRPLPGGLGDVAFDLDHVVVTAVTDSAGQPLSWRHDGARLSVTGLGPDGGVVVIHYGGTPARGLYFVGPSSAEPDRGHQVWSQCQDDDGHCFFPCIDHPSVKAPMGLEIRAPKGYTVVSNGRLVDREGDLWRWEQAEPIPAYLVTVVVARLTVLEDSWEGRPVRYLAPTGTDDATLRRVFGKTPAMMAFLSARTGVPYPWPRYDQVVVYEFIFGGMENVAATTLTDLVLTDERAALDYDADDLVVHELAHQWFGDLVTCQDWSQAWLNEGWATYSEHLWKTHDLGPDEADYALFGQLGEYLTEESGRYSRAIIHYGFREPIDLFDRHLYEKGGLVLHTLRHSLGDGPFFAGVQGYLERHRHGTVHTRHFQRALEDATGRNLDHFFQQWVESPGHPAVTVETDWEDGRLNVTVTQTQSGDGVPEAFHFTLPLAIAAGDQITEVALPVRERSRTWTLPCPTAPDRVEVDAGFRALADLTVKGSRGRLIASLQSDRGVIGRIRAARALAGEASPAAIAALCRALTEDSFWGVRVEIAGLLGKLGGDRAREALLGALAEPHPKARKAVVNALGEHRHPDVVSALTTLALDGDPSIQVEGEAARSLGRGRAANAVEVCQALLSRDSWGEVLRARALEGLGHTRAPEALPLLLDASTIAWRSRVRAAAAGALGRLADELPSARLAAVDRLVELAQDAPFRVRMAAISGLGVARDPRSAGALQALHEAADDGRLKRQAYEALQKVSAGRTGDDALAALRRDLDGLRDQNRDLRDRLAKLEGGP